MKNTGQPELSIVVPMKDEAGNLQPLMEALCSALHHGPDSWEVIFINDGSEDDSWEILKSLNRTYPNVRGVRFTRNYGHQIALLAGLEAARGKAVVSMDADLQHPPFLIPEMLAQWKNGFDIVHTQRIDTKQLGLFKRTTTRWFYRLFSYLSGVSIEQGSADFRLLDRKVVDSVLRYVEHKPFYRAIVRDIGYAQTTLPFECGQRLSGSTKYTVRQMFALAWNGVFSFSTIPLRLSIYVGFITSLVALVGVIYAIFSWLVLKSTVQGWTSLLSISSFLMGIQFIILGILGEYINRIHQEVTHRPRYLVDEVLESSQHTPADK